MELFIEWSDFILCLPFRLGFQGVWEDTPDPKISQFTSTYGPLFASFSPLSEYGYLYAMLKMLHTLVCVWIVGSSIKASPIGHPSESQATNHGTLVRTLTPTLPLTLTPTRSNSDPYQAQLWTLVVVTALQILFLLFQVPFNERIENLIQIFTAGCQTWFFYLLAMTPAAEVPDPAALNNVNMLAMMILMAASLKG